MLIQPITSGLMARQASQSTSGNPLLSAVGVSSMACSPGTGDTLGGAPMQGCEHPEAHRQSEHADPREREGYPSADGPLHAAPPSKGFSSPQEAHTEPVCTVSSQASFTSACS